MADIEPDRLAIAQQVIKSAGDVLRAAGFDREEIGSFFRQAADSLGGGPAQPRGEAPSPNCLADRLAAEFAETPPGRELAQLNGQIVRLGLPQGQAPLAGHFDLAMKMIPLIAEAQNCVRVVAGKAGLQIHADRHTGADAADALYFDDFRTLWADGFDLIGALIAALSQRGDEEAFAFLLESLLENSVVISFELKEAIERAAEALSGPR